MWHGSGHRATRAAWLCDRVCGAADDYTAVLNTYQGHRALDGDRRQRLLTRIHRRIEARPERNVRKTHLAMLFVAGRV